VEVFGVYVLNIYIYIYIYIYIEREREREREFFFIIFFKRNTIEKVIRISNINQ